MHLADAAAAAAEARLEFGVSPPLPRGATINMQRSVELAELLENMAIDGDVGRAAALLLWKTTAVASQS